MKTIFRVVTNKFLLTGIAFAIWMIYFDQNSWSVQQDRKKELVETERNIAYLDAEISKMEKEYYEMKNNPERLEKYAREKFKMKKDNEDLYLIDN